MTAALRTLIDAIGLPNVIGIGLMIVAAALHCVGACLRAKEHDHG